MRTGKGFAFWLLSMFMTFSLTAAAWAAMSDEDFVQLCEEGTVKEIRAELQKEANPNAKDRVGNTALMLATKNPNPEVVSLLLKAGADVNVKDRDGGTALIWSVTPNSTSEVVSYLLKAGADVNTKDNNGMTALMLAALTNPKPEVVSLLLKARANVNAQFKDGSTALMNAVWSTKSPEVVSLLLKAGADVNAKDEDGKTALMNAAGYNKNPEVISLLLKAGADINAKDKNNKSALDWALWHGNTDVIKELMEFTAVPVGAMPDEDFVELCENGTVKEIRTALLNGTDPNVKDKEGMTTVMVAAMSHAKWDHGTRSVLDRYRVSHWRRSRVAS